MSNSGKLYIYHGYEWANYQFLSITFHKPQALVMVDFWIILCGVQECELGKKQFINLH